MSLEEFVLLGSLVVLSGVDLRTRKIPLVPVLALGMFFVIYRIWSGAPVLELVTGTIPGGILILVAAVTKESIGYGDGVVLVVFGLLCGAVKTVAVLGMALLLAAVVSMILLALKKVGRKTELPFLPCLCSGYLLFLLW